MPAPAWLRWTLAAAMICVALYHSGRLANSHWRRGQRPDPGAQVDVELTHAAMGSAMTLMVLDVMAPGDLRGVGLVFGALTLWFALRAVYSYVMDGPRAADLALRQVIGCAAMTYMLVALAAPSIRPAVAPAVTSEMNGMSMSGVGPSVLSPLSSPVLRVIVIGATVALCGWTFARMRARCADAGPALGLGCQLAVNATTIYMLVTM
jgi:hypothetical protein